MNQSPIAPRSILVVDDEPFVCDAVRRMLAFDGHSVKTVSDGTAALEMLKGEKFDLVITDFAMPGMKGDELAQTIKKLRPEQSVVMITAYAELLVATGNPLRGVDMVLAKPFLLENLREAISKAAPLGAPTA
jgi:CheY-like chemotaxis protein